MARRRIGCADHRNALTAEPYPRLIVSFPYVPCCRHLPSMIDTADPTQMALRVGIGHDTHRLGPGGPLVMGGLQLDHDQHAIGHSDADVLLHSITDALLGASSLGDIGELFPDTDPANKDKDSAEMLQAAVAKVRQAGFKIVNLDCIVFAQRPKLSPYKLAIRSRIAEILGVSGALVGVKAKTGESVGPIGREEAIAAQCVVLLETA